MKSVTLFCDGSSLGNPGPGGYGIILRYKDIEKEYSGGAEHTTNNIMELTAVIEGLKLLQEPCKVEIYSDSTYVVRGINEWLRGWQKKAFKNVKNIPLWKEYLNVSAGHIIRAIWVKGHAGHSENERCDTLAKEMALTYKHNVTQHQEGEISSIPKR